MYRISLVLVTFLSLLSSTAFATLYPPTDTPRDLRVMSWNIYMLPPIAPVRGRMERAAAIADTLRHADADIIVFQEAFHKKAVDVIRQGLISTYPYMYGPFNPSHTPFRTCSGVWIISRIPLELKGTIEYTVAKESDKFAKKGAALLEGTWNGKKFQILGTHLQAQNQAKIRLIQTQHIYDSLLTKYKVEGVPQIICGDMNTEVEIEQGYKSMLSTLHAEDIETTGDQKMTYDGTNNELALSIWKNAKTTLDYILLRKNGAEISVTKKYVSMFKKPWRKGKHDLSDHYAIICELRY